MFALRYAVASKAAPEVAAPGPMAEGGDAGQPLKKPLSGAASGAGCLGVVELRLTSLV